jgi:predicted Zn-dependent peptidase
VRTGSRDEDLKINGVSHFLEHMLFKGAEKLDYARVNFIFDKNGAQYNAFTSEENTVFWAAVLPEYLIEITQLWAELMRPALRTDDFNMEKQVIKEEIAMYLDQPQYDVGDRCRALHYGGHPCGHSVLGSTESIDAMTAEQMREYFENRYAPNNIVAAFAGNFEWDTVLPIVQNGCSAWQKKDVSRKLSDYPGTGRKERISRANVTTEHICFISRCVSAQDERRFAAALLETIIGDSSGSRFFWALVDPAIAETAALQYGAMDGTGAYFGYVRCNTENASKAMGIVAKIYDDLAAKGVTEDELRMARNKVLSALVLKNEIPMGRLVDLGGNWIYLNKYRPIEQDVAAIKAVTVKDINALIEEFDLRRFTQFSIGPA